MLPAFQALDIPVTKTILLHGVSGVGKTTLVQHIAKNLKYLTYHYHIRELLAFSEQFDEPGFDHFNTLYLTFKRARANSPSIILIKGLDLLRTDSKAEASARSTILSLLRKNVKSINPEEQVFVIGLATGLKQLPEHLRSLDIFDQHEHIPIPTRPQREAILKTLITHYNLKFDVKDDDYLDTVISRISQSTSGYVAKDLKLLLRSAALHAMRRPTNKEPNQDISVAMNALSLAETSDNDSTLILWQDVEYAIEHSSPSQQASFETTIDKRSWTDIGGYAKLKKKLQRAVLLPISNPEKYKMLGIPPPSGILLFGPSGCGKSLLVQALASESIMNVITVKGPEIFSKYLGESEAAIRNLFATAKRISPCIVFIDEMDSIACKRGWDAGEGGNSVNERLLSTLLNEMDGVEGRQGVFVVGCTNRPDQIDDAILRPGRLDLLLHVDLPTKEDRQDIIQLIISRMSVADDVSVEHVAEATRFCTGADLNSIFREAARTAIREDPNIQRIYQRHIEASIDRIQRRAEVHATDGSLQVFRKFTDRDMQ
ncbi:P-loop containing nucleoside triphosphate hydrolase protein [Umbelopsis sp. PMI_123]|nr:P-loop containing nucleoside triphosphate hydrolase protein [Umbelopsis sp. PMI_123]